MALRPEAAVKTGAEPRERPAGYATRVSGGCIRKRWWLGLVAVFMGLAWAQTPLADLSVTAFGTQRLDLATGRTILEDGGEVIDQRSGVRLTAEWIAYVEGERLEARQVVVDAALGRVEAATVAIDLTTGRLRASGGVVLTRPGFEAQAARFGLDPGAELAWLDGDVSASAPEATASSAFFDLVDGRVVLEGPYRFVGDPFTLEGDAGGRLQLDPVTIGDVTTFDARTSLDADLVDRIAGFASRTDPEVE